MDRARPHVARALLFALLATAAHAADEDGPPAQPAPPPPVVDVGEVSVTATRAERSVLDVPGNVTVIDRAAIERSGARDVAALLPDRSLDLWRLSLPPASGAIVVASLGERLDAADYFYDWGGGLLWIAAPPAAEMGGALQAAIGRSGGHAVLVRGSVASREAAYKGSAASAALAQLAQRLKDAFDPLGILNTGRAPAAG